MSKLNATGSALAYSTYLGGSGYDEAWSVAVDASGNAYITGDASSTDFPITSGTFQTTYGGGNFDAFVSKFSLAAGIPFSRFGGSLLIDPDAGVFYLSGGFKLGARGQHQSCHRTGDLQRRQLFGDAAARRLCQVQDRLCVPEDGQPYLPVCVYQIHQHAGCYALLVNRIGGTLTTTSPVPVTLAIGNESGTAQMNARFD